MTTPKLCRDCKHLAKSSVGDAQSWKCMAEQNIISRDVDLVTGEMIVRRHFLTCYDARRHALARTDNHQLTVENCGPEGRWFEERPAQFMEVVPTGKPGQFTSRPVAADLLSQLDSMK